MCPGFSNYGATITMSDKNARPILLSKNALRSGDIFLEGRLRLLNDADVEAILDKNVVNALPARTICPSTVNQNNIPNAASWLCAESIRQFSSNKAMQRN